MRKLETSEIRAMLMKLDIKLLSPEYLGMHKKAALQCCNGHQFEATIASIKWGGTGCPTCAGRTAYKIEEIKTLVANKGGTIKDKIPPKLTAKTLIKVTCNKHHSWKIRLYRLRQGRWCPKCGHSRTYSDEDLVLFLQSLVKKLGRLPTIGEYGGEGPDYSTVMKRLGGRKRAFARANIKELIPTKKISIEAIRKAAESTGRAPTRQFFDSQNMWPSSSQISKLFGSWTAAVKAAGYKPRKGVGGGAWKTWETLCRDIAICLFGRAQVVEQYRFARGRNMSVDVFVKSIGLAIDAKLSAYFHESHSGGQIERFLKCKQFKRIEFWCLSPGALDHPRVKVVLAEELEQTLVRTKNPGSKNLIARIRDARNDSDLFRSASGLPTRQSLIDDLKRFERNHGKFPTQRELTPSNGLKSGGTYHGVFGSYTSALIAAGAPIPRTHWRTVSDDELIAKFEEFMREKNGGKVPTCTQLHGLIGYPNLGVLVRRAGSYRKWLKLCGLESTRPEIKMTKQASLELLRKAYAVSKAPLVGKDNDFRRFVTHAPSARWYAEMFGSWNNALKKAGLPLRRKTPVQETKNSTRSQLV